MKHQQIQLASKRNFIRIMALVAMLAVMVCGMILAVNADAASVTFSNDSNVKLENGYWVKVYDGNTAVTGTVTVDGVTATAVFNSANAGDTSITLTYGSETITVPAKIKPAQLTWAADGIASTTYNPTDDVHDGVSVTTVPALNGIIGNDAVSVKNATALTVSVVASNIGEVYGYTSVELEGAQKDNYTVEPLKVKVTVNPIEITSITWEGIASFTYGDNAWLNIKAIGHYGNNKTVEMIVEDLATIVNAGNYTLTANVPNALYTIKAGVSAIQDIAIAKKTYNVVLNGREFLDNGDLTTAGAGAYQLVVEGANGEQLPAEVLDAIQYTYNGSEALVTKPGTYTVKATIPTLVNYDFNVTTLEATMTVVRNYIIVSTPDGAIVILGENGISNSVTATLNVPTEFARKAIRGLKTYKGYTINITGAQEGDAFSILIPVAADIIAKKNCLPMSADNLYIYNGTDKALAKDTYSVSLSEDGSYYIIEGYVPAGEITFMLAPDFKVPFWSSAIGIALIVLIALILLVVVPIFVGMKLIQLEKSGRNPVIAVETEGNVPEVEPVVIPDVIDDPDAVIEEGVDALAETLAEEVAPEEAEAADVDATDAVAEAMDDLNAEVAGIELETAEDALGEKADQIADELADQVDADNGIDVSEEVQQAVAEAMAENFNESADATDAIALVEDEEPVAEEVVEEVVAPAADAEESEDDEEESFGGFGSMPLDYIDAVAEAERYAEMLEQESRGEVQLVTRYRRSYLSRLAQSQGSIQDYYNAIKNLLLSYKGVKSRISWNFESFNVGRTPLAKFNAKTRTLYVYIGLSPEELADSKYNFTDMSAKKKYAAVPVLLKVKGERKFKHAFELLTMLCEEKLQLPKKKTFQEVDYRMPFKTTEELVNEGIIKMMVAAVPVAPVAEEVVAEEVVAEEVVAEEVVAEEAVVEEAVVEEAVVEEAPVEEAIAEEVATEEAVEEAVAAEEFVEEAVVEETPADEAVENNDQNA